MMHNKPLQTIVLSAALLFVWGVTSCQKGTNIEQQELLVLCGGSFRLPLERLAKSYEAQGDKLVLSFGQSEDLLPQVKLRQEGDVFVTHDPYLKYVKDAGALLDYGVVGHVAPVLVVANGNPKGVQSISDLARSGLRICLPNPDFSTCGKMVFDLLEKKGIRKAVMDNVGNALFRSHSQVGSAIKLSHCDAGMMWNGVAHTWSDALDIVATPYEYSEEIRVTVIGLKHSKNPEAVRRLLGYAKREGKSIFEQAGYVK